MTATTMFPLKLLPGDLFSYADTRPQHWDRDYYRVAPCGPLAVPVAREHFWNSTRGKVEIISDEPSKTLTYGPSYKHYGFYEGSFCLLRPETSLPAQP